MNGTYMNKFYNKTLFLIITIIVELTSCVSENQVAIPPTPSTFSEVEGSENPETATPTMPPTMVEETFFQNILNLNKGEYLIFSNRSGVYAYSFSDNSKTLLFTKKGWTAVSSDGHYFAFYDENSNNLIVINIPSQKHNTYTLDGECRFMSIASNGEWVACGGGEIYLYLLKNEEKFSLTSGLNSDTEDSWDFPIWSSDSKRIAFQNLRDFQSGENDGWYITDIECIKEFEKCKDYTLGPFAQEISFTNGSLSAVSWSSDGESIYIPGMENIYKYDIAQKTLSVFFGNFGSPNMLLSPNGKQFVVDDFSDGIKYLISMDNMEVETLNLFGIINGWLIVQ